MQMRQRKRRVLAMKSGVPFPVTVLPLPAWLTALLLLLLPPVARCIGLRASVAFSIFTVDYIYLSDVAKCRWGQRTDLTQSRKCCSMIYDRCIASFNPKGANSLKIRWIEMAAKRTLVFVRVIIGQWNRSDEKVRHIDHVDCSYIKRQRAWWTSLTDRPPTQQLLPFSRWSYQWRCSRWWHSSFWFATA